ncbi:MAG: ABC transporter ATP-binding protein [Candidatus Thorarchaeota archaeon]
MNKINNFIDEQKNMIVVRGLKTQFFTYAGVVQALNSLNFEIRRGETLAIVGETGCGKSITAHSILRLVRHPGKIVAGKVYYKGQYSNDRWINLLELHENEMRKIRGHYITMIFQDPMTYLNPVFKIDNQLIESILLHQELREEAVLAKIDQVKAQMNGNPENNDGLKKELNRLDQLLSDPPKPSKEERQEAARWKALNTLKLVRMPYPENIMNSYPFELSGGMRQRVMIAMALSLNPDILIADEATTALDVTIQAQILTLLEELKERLGTTLVIITHDLGIVAEQADRVLVMYAGNIIEEGPTSEIFKNPVHPYTKGLLSAIPKLGAEKLPIIPGTVPNLVDPPSGCRFHPRCPDKLPICETEFPKRSKINENHFVSCHPHGTENYVVIEEIDMQSANEEIEREVSVETK